MARNPAPKPIGAPLPKDWRDQIPWQIPPMLAKIDPRDYDATASAFEAAQRGRLSDDWAREWRNWCRAILVSQHETLVLPERLFG